MLDTRHRAPAQIDCDLLFDGMELRRQMRVTLAGGRIGQVQPQNGRPSSPGASLEGSPPSLRVPFLMPGLIDSHVHVSGYVEGLPAGAPFEPVKHFLRLCTYNGVTTVRDTGNSLDTVLYAREWSERYLGPRLFAAGPLLDQPPLTWPHSRIVRDEAGVRREVRRLHDHDVDLLKAYRQIPPDLLGAIVRAGRDHGLPVAVDSEMTSAREAADLGVRSVEHLHNVVDTRSFPPADVSGAPGRAMRWSHVDVDSRAVDETVSALKSNGTFVVPTMLVARRWCLLEEVVNDPHLDWMALVMPYHRHFKSLRNPIGMRIGRQYMSQYLPIPALGRDERADVEAGLERMGQVLRLLFEAGVNVAAGTDSPNPSLAPGFSLHQELKYMVRCGVPAVAALRSVTSSAAALLGQEDVGAVKPGCRADLLVLDGDPTQDIEDLSRVRGVLRGGQWVDRDGVGERLREAAAELARRR